MLKTQPPGTSDTSRIATDHINNPNAINPAGPYYGLYQFDVQTWQANGGTGTPQGKSIAEQTRVAYNLYQARGRAPWPVCGKNL